MVLLYITIPFMVLAVLWAMGFVTFHSWRENRRLWAEKTMNRHIAPPDDGRTHLAATIKPGEEAAASELVDRRTAEAEPHEAWSGVETTAAQSGRRVLVSVPEKQGSADEVAKHLADDGAFEDVEKL